MDRLPGTTGLSAAWSAFPMWWRSFAYLRQHGLRRHHLAGPAVLAVLTLLGWWFADHLTGTLKTRIHEQLDPWLAPPDADPVNEAPWWSWSSEWITGALDTLAEWTVLLAVLWLKVKVLKYLLITIMAPFMSLLAADVIRTETGQSSPPSLLAFLRDLIRGLRISFVLLTMEISLGILLWAIGFAAALLFPPLAVVLSPLLIAASWLVGAYFFGAAVFDAPYEQSGMSWGASLRTGWKARGHLVGIGLIFSALLAVPFIGAYVAALLGPVPCTTAATRLHLASKAGAPDLSERLNPLPS